MLTTTTNNVKDKPVKEYLGIITGKTIIGANFIRDFFAEIRDIKGRQIGILSKVLRGAKNSAMSEMLQRAEHMGANATTGIYLDNENVGPNSGMFMVTASGTDVKI